MTAALAAQTHRIKKGSWESRNAVDEKKWRHPSMAKKMIPQWLHPIFTLRICLSSIITWFQFTAALRENLVHNLMGDRPALVPSQVPKGHLGRYSSQEGGLSPRKLTNTFPLPHRWLRRARSYESVRHPRTVTLTIQAESSSMSPTSDSVSD